MHDFLGYILRQRIALLCKLYHLLLQFIIVSNFTPLGTSPFLLCHTFYSILFYSILRLAPTEFICLHIFPGLFRIKLYNLQMRVIADFAGHWRQISCGKVNLSEVDWFALRPTFRGQVGFFLRSCRFIETYRQAVYLYNIYIWHVSPHLSCHDTCQIWKWFTMTSSNGNIFRVTGPLWGEFTGHRWIPLTKASDTELWCFLWSAPWMNGSVNNREADNLRRHRAH